MEICKEEERITFGLPDIGIPAEVLFHPELTVNDKLLFGFIRNLSQSSKGCWATNKYLGALLNLKKRAVSKAISKLEKCKYIIINFETASDNSVIRRIFVNPDMNKIYQKMVEEIHDQIRKGDTPHSTQMLRGGSTQMLRGGSTQMLRGWHTDAIIEGVNEGGNREGVRDNTSVLSSALSTKSASRRRRKKPSMKDRTNHKAAAKVSKKKKNKKVPYETTPNLQLLEVWNLQDNLRKHTQRTTQTYKNALHKLEMLRQGKLNKIINKNALPKDIPQEWLTTKWKKTAISRAIKILDAWCKEGNYPTKKGWVKKLSLGDAVFNSRSGSPLMQAYKYGVKPVYNPEDHLTDEQETSSFYKFQKFFGEQFDRTDIKTQQQLVTLIKNLKGLREKHKPNWQLHDPELFGYGYPPSTLHALTIDYIEFLKGYYDTDFTPNERLTPNGLKQGTYVFEKFKKAYWDRFGADVIEGPK